MLIELGEDINGKTYFTQYCDVEPKSIRLETKPGFYQDKNLRDNPHRLVFTGRKALGHPIEDFSVSLNLTSSFKIFYDRFSSMKTLESDISLEVLKNGTRISMLRNMRMHARNGIYYQTISSQDDITVRIKTLHSSMNTDGLISYASHAKDYVVTEFTAFRRTFDINGQTINADNESIFTFRVLQEKG